MTDPMQHDAFEWISMIGGAIGGIAGAAAAIAAFLSFRISARSLATSERIASLTKDAARLQHAGILKDLHPVVQNHIDRVLDRHRKAFDACEAMIKSDSALIEAALEAHHGYQIARPLIRDVDITSVNPAEIVQDHFPNHRGIDRIGSQGIWISFNCLPLSIDMGNDMSDRNEAIKTKNDDAPRFGAHHVLVQSKRLYDTLWQTLHLPAQEMHALRNLVLQYGAEDLALSLIEHDWRALLAYEAMLTGFRAPPQGIRDVKLIGMSYVVEHGLRRYTVIKASRRK